MERMKEKGVSTITVGTGLETSREAVRLADENDFLYATAGIHPNHEEDWSEELEELSKNETDNNLFYPICSWYNNV